MLAPVESGEDSTSSATDGAMKLRRGELQHSVQAFESLGSFKMYYAIGAPVSSLHRESTDSLIQCHVNS